MPYVASTMAKVEPSTEQLNRLVLLPANRARTHSWTDREQHLRSADTIQALEKRGEVFSMGSSLRALERDVDQY